MKMKKCLFYLISFYIVNVAAIFKGSGKFSMKNYVVANTQVYYKTSSTENVLRLNERFFYVNISNNNHTVFITSKKLNSVLNKKTEILRLTRDSWLKSNFSEVQADIVDGYITNYFTSSGVNGYVSNGKFYGTIIFEGRVYYVENKEKFPSISKLYSKVTDLNALIYEKDSFVYESNTSNTWKRSVPTYFSAKNDIDYQQIYKNFIKERNICSLLILLDNSFLKIIHQGDVSSALAQVLLSINEVNSVFRGTDFDENGEPDNIGFVVKYLVIIENVQSAFNFMPPYSQIPANPSFYLAHFAQYLTLREVCLGILFTAQSFQSHVLGVSYSAVSEADMSHDIVGGLCQRPFRNYMLSLNSLAVSYVATDGVHLSQSTLDTCLIHELGHAFGCRHDRTTDSGYEKQYIMSSHTLPGTDARNFQFSPTSRQHVVITIPKKGWCMTHGTEPFCGNGIIEEGEVCDCGASFSCPMKDMCCVPSGMNGACQVNEEAGYECHPSQGFCCSPYCKFEDLREHGVNCKLMNHKCPCTYENQQCYCGIGGRCLGTVCQSEECVRIDAEECDCPLNSKNNTCEICCLANSKGPCESSQSLTRRKLEMGLITIKQLKLFEYTKSLPSETRQMKFCHSRQCVTLDFKSSTLGKYCILNGKLGICTANGCNVKQNNMLAEKSGKTTSLNFNCKSDNYFQQIKIFSCVFFVYVLNFIS